MVKSMQVTHHPGKDGTQFSTVEDAVAEAMKSAANCCARCAHVVFKRGACLAA
jgi:hypothetical protein